MGNTVINYEITNQIDSLMRSSSFQRSDIYKLKFRIGMLPKGILIEYFQFYFFKNFKFFDPKKYITRFVMTKDEDSLLDQSFIEIELRKDYYYLKVLTELKDATLRHDEVFYILKQPKDHVLRATDKYRKSLTARYFDLVAVVLNYQLEPNYVILADLPVDIDVGQTQQFLCNYYQIEFGKLRIVKEQLLSTKFCNLILDFKENYKICDGFAKKIQEEGLTLNQTEDMVFIVELKPHDYYKYLFRTNRDPSKWKFNPRYNRVQDNVQAVDRYFNDMPRAETLFGEDYNRRPNQPRGTQQEFYNQQKEQMYYQSDTYSQKSQGGRQEPGNFSNKWGDDAEEKYQQPLSDCYQQDNRMFNQGRGQQFNSWEERQQRERQGGGRGGGRGYRGNDYNRQEGNYGRNHGFGGDNEGGLRFEDQNNNRFDDNRFVDRQNFRDNDRGRGGDRAFGRGGDRAFGRGGDRQGGYGRGGDREGGYGRGGERAFGRGYDDRRRSSSRDNNDFKSGGRGRGRGNFGRGRNDDYRGDYEMREQPEDLEQSIVQNKANETYSDAWAEVQNQNQQENQQPAGRGKSFGRGQNNSSVMEDVEPSGAGRGRGRGRGQSSQESINYHEHNDDNKKEEDNGQGNKDVSMSGQSDGRGQKLSQEDDNNREIGDRPGRGRGRGNESNWESNQEDINMAQENSGEGRARGRGRGAFGRGSSNSFGDKSDNESNSQNEDRGRGRSRGFGRGGRDFDNNNERFSDRESDISERGRGRAYGRGRGRDDDSNNDRFSDRRSDYNDRGRGRGGYGRGQDRNDRDRGGYNNNRGNYDQRDSGRGRGRGNRDNYEQRDSGRGRGRGRENRDDNQEKFDDLWSNQNEESKSNNDNKWGDNE